MAVQIGVDLDALGPVEDGAVLASPVRTWTWTSTSSYRDVWRPTRTAAAAAAGDGT